MMLWKPARTHTKFGCARNCNTGPAATLQKPYYLRRQYKYIQQQQHLYIEKVISQLMVGSGQSVVAMCFFLGNLPC
jgi:hypothetical protein